MFALANDIVPVVGIGASAGGIAALEGFFRGVPANSGIAFVVVTHLNPERESALPEILARFTAMPVRAATPDAEIAPDTVLVMPSDAILTVDDGHMRLIKQTRNRHERKPIDVFLGSLAKSRREYAASVILSGGDGDGTLGSQAVKEYGGLTLAQAADGDGPQHPEMPQTAIASGSVDIALPAGAMGAKLAAYFADLRQGTALAPSGDAAASVADDARDEICAILRNQVGHDFSGYKSKTFVRRVGRRMRVHQLDSVQAYLALLRESPAEVTALFRDLLINVTTFFRDAEAFDKLAEMVIPELFEGRGAQDSIRIWVPGCATGEEAYSVAILLREHMDTVSAVPRVQIFATDIDASALDVARAGRYPEALLDGVSPERRRRFFRLDGTTHVLTKDVRELCVFSPHSIIRDPPFSRLDMVSCRNLLIYLGAEAQRQVIPVFHYALRSGGFLFLGASENASQFTDLFTPIDKKARIFRSRDVGPAIGRPPLVLTAPPLAPARPRPSADQRQPSGFSLRDTIQAQVLDRHAPPHVVVNREGDIVHYSARTGRYLEPPAGQPSRQLLSMARKDLRLDLRALLRDATEQNARVRRNGVIVEADDGHSYTVDLTVEPLAAREGGPLYLVLFSNESPVNGAARRGELDDDRNQALEQELRETRERLQSMIEEYETALEEIRSSNEELVSVNEELQSANEELEASKEELQSLNEELHAVNAELLAKVEALDLANSDLVNLFESAEIATVFLDTGLVIRSFTPAVSRVFNILPADYGRPITDLASKLEIPTLQDDIAQAFAGGPPRERRIRALDGEAHFLMRAMPYRSASREIEGVVVSFVDVTSLTEAEARQRLLIAELQHRTRNLLAVVRAISTQTILTSNSKEEFESKFTARLGALARVQSLLSAEPGAVTAGALVRLELSALNADIDGKRVTLSGEDIALEPGIVRVFALALHELATNALKHGALASETGTLDVRWTREGDLGAPRLRLEWRETLDPPRVAETPAHQGFGRELIERALPYQLGAETEYRLTPEGVRCVLLIPLSHRSD